MIDWILEISIELIRILEISLELITILEIICFKTMLLNEN